jgi:hypothetical protein
MKAKCSQTVAGRKMAETNDLGDPQQNLSRDDPAAETQAVTGESQEDPGGGHEEAVDEQFVATQQVLTEADIATQAVVDTQAPEADEVIYDDGSEVFVQSAPAALPPPVSEHKEAVRAKSPQQDTTTAPASHEPEEPQASQQQQQQPDHDVQQDESRSLEPELTQPLNSQDNGDGLASNGAPGDDLQELEAADVADLAPVDADNDEESFGLTIDESAGGQPAPQSPSHEVTQQANESTTTPSAAPAAAAAAAGAVVSQAHLNLLKQMLSEDEDDEEFTVRPCDFVAVGPVAVFFVRHPCKFL